MEVKFSKIRRELDSLGYFQIVSVESIPVVAKLLEDLKTTTGSLQKYMKKAQTAIKEKEDFELSLGPQKLDNEKLVRECNDLHSTYLNYRSQKEKDIKALRDKVLFLNEENAKLILENDKLRTSLRETELDLMKSTTATKKSQQGSRSSNKSVGQSNHSSPDEELLQENVEIRHELNELKKELKNLQCKCHRLGVLGGESSPDDGEDEIVRRKSSTIDYKYSEDKIRRLQDEIRYLQREKNDLEKTYKDALSRQHEAMKRAIHLAERNKELEKELKDIDQMAIAVEEECNDAVKNKTRKLTKVEMALKDALQEIQTLERTIVGMKKDKQEIELNNDILKTEKKRMQDSLEDAIKEKSSISEQLNNMKLIEHDLNFEIDKLAQENAKQKRTIAELESKIVVAQVVRPTRGPGGDGVALQVAPVTIKSAKSTKGKKPKKEKKKPKQGKKGKTKGAKKGKGKKGKRTRITSSLSQAPVNSLTDVEIDKELKEFFPIDHNGQLPPPIPLLPREGVCPCGTQTQHPCLQQESGNQRTSQKLDDSEESCVCLHPKKPAITCDCYPEPQVRCCTDKTTLTEAFRSGCCDNMCLMHFRDLMQKEIDQCQYEIKQNLVKVTQERNHYIEEYHKLVNQMCQMQSQNKRQTDASCCPMCPKAQQVVEFLQQENKMLSQEKMTLMARLEETRNDNEIIGRCNKSSCKRIQRERDLYKADMTRLQDECDCLRDSIQMLCEAKSREHDTFTQQLNNYEKQMKKMESERSELMNSQGSRRAQLNSLEEKNEMMKNMLRSTQDDLQNQRILYNQLKNLQDQTDKALHDTQGQLFQLERELGQAYQTIEQLKRPSKDSKKDLAEIDLNTMKRQLNRMDQEKDDLLNIVDSKTEEIATLKRDIMCKCDIIDELKQKNMDLKGKLGNLTDRTAASGAFLKETEAEVSRLQKHLDMATKTRDNALEVNRKLQDELAAITREATTFKAQLTSSQEQIENLKLQSQQYIAEVKRAEDLIEGKNGERLNDLRHEAESLTAKLTESQTKLANTERLLKEARHQGVEMKLKDEEALNEMSLLKGRIDDLEKRLFRCTCDVCTEKCIASLVCEKGCITGQVMSTTINLHQDKRQVEPASSQLHSPTNASFPKVWEPVSLHEMGTTGNNALVATAQVFVTGEGDTETVTVNVNPANSPSDSAGFSVSSVRINVGDDDGEVSFHTGPLRGSMTTRVESVRGSLSFGKTRNAACDHRSSSSISAKESSNGALEIEEWIEPRKQAVVSSQPGNHCKTAKCYPECKLFDPLKRVCRKRSEKGSKIKKGCNNPSVEKLIKK